MKALIRNPGETVLESYDLAFIDWNTGAPLTNPDWFGGPYILVNDYVQTADEDFAEAPEPEIVTESAPADPQGSAQGPKANAKGKGTSVPLGSRDAVPREDEETVTIDGKEYTREELLAIIKEV